jgi:hypothetical protein
MTGRIAHAATFVTHGATLLSASTALGIHPDVGFEVFFVAGKSVATFAPSFAARTAIA